MEQTTLNAASVHFPLSISSGAYSFYSTIPHRVNFNETQKIIFVYFLLKFELKVKVVVVKNGLQ